METDWSVEAGADDPLIETGWHDAGTRTGWSDLRVEPARQAARIAALPECATPAMAAALATLNAPDGVLVTTKCDRWVLDAEERASLADALDLPAAEHGVGSYIDVLMAYALPLTDFLLHEEWARMATRRAAALDHPAAKMELIIRPARREGSWGYGLTAYHSGAGASREAAEAAWSAALSETVPLLIVAAQAMFAPACDVRPAEKQT